MEGDLIFDFKVIRDNKTIAIQREFDAQISLVWSAWTTSELLDQWWGPKPWRAETKEMDFREGGHWHYAMVGPEGEKHWSRAAFIKIVDEKSFSVKDGFCDEEGEINPNMPQSLWENQFNQQQGKTLVSMYLSFDTVHDLDQNLEMGFQEGFTMCLNQLDELLEHLKQA
ncbi:MAG TPA: SRPBCC domain-containing protein [Cyclobacteriaceae bacterium]|nr:SRPBCC domain-containing protein [Cyclobacteriaceae bacterium]